MDYQLFVRQLSQIINQILTSIYVKTFNVNIITLTLETNSMSEDKKVAAFTL